MIKRVSKSWIEQVAFCAAVGLLIAAGCGGTTNESTSGGDTGGDTGGLTTGGTTTSGTTTSGSTGSTTTGGTTTSGTTGSTTTGGTTTSGTTGSTTTGGTTTAGTTGSTTGGTTGGTFPPERKGLYYDPNFSTTLLVKPDGNVDAICAVSDPAFTGTVQANGAAAFTVQMTKPDGTRLNIIAVVTDNGTTKAVTGTYALAFTGAMDGKYVNDGTNLAFRGAGSCQLKQNATTVGNVVYAVDGAGNITGTLNLAAGGSVPIAGTCSPIGKFTFTGGTSPTYTIKGAFFFDNLAFTSVQANGSWTASDSTAGNITLSGVSNP